MEESRSRLDYRATQVSRDWELWLASFGPQRRPDKWMESGDMHGSLPFAVRYNGRPTATFRVCPGERGSQIPAVATEGARLDQRAWIVLPEVRRAAQDDIKTVKAHLWPSILAL